MKRTLNLFWLISAGFLALAAAWGAIPGFATVMDGTKICAVALIIFSVISVLAALTAGARTVGSGWLVFDGIISFACGLSLLFSYVYHELFSVELIYVLGLWLMLLGVSQISRISRTAKRSAGRFIAVIFGAVGILGGLTLFVKPIYTALPFAEYGTAFLLGAAAVLVAVRCFAGGSSRK